MNYENIVNEWLSKPVMTIEDLDTRLENFRILFAYNSNAIENPQITYHDTREVFENGKVIGFTGDLRTLYEIQNQKVAYEMLQEKILAKEALSVPLILSIHEALMHGCYDERRWQIGERPGTFKKHDYMTGDGIGSAPEDVENEVASLCEEVNEAKTEPEAILTIASYLHLRFETIHPFADGNGRVGRTLLNYYLLTHEHPPLVIYDEDKRSYYMALTLYDKTERIDGLEAFLKEQLVKTWSKAPAPKKRLRDLV